MSENPWIEWVGGECPVDPEVLVDARFRDGKQVGPAAAGGWSIGISCWLWEGKFRDFDIIAYRLAP